MLCAQRIWCASACCLSAVVWPSGHTSGVFISTCSSSPRSHQPCAFLAAVVSNKALLAELYIPRDIAPPDPWAGLLTHTVPDTSNGGSACSSNASSSTCSSMAGTDPQSNKSSHQASSSSSAAVCAAAASVELWLSSAVQLQSPQQHAQPAAAAGGRGAGGGRAAARGGRGHRDRGGRRDAAAGDSWRDIHRFIVECIGRCLEAIYKGSSQTLLVASLTIAYFCKGRGVCWAAAFLIDVGAASTCIGSCRQQLDDHPAHTFLIQ